MVSFDDVIDREGTDAIKYEAPKARLDGERLLPMWVADMDFRSPEPVVEALEARARHGVFGYTIASDGVYDAVRSWQAERHGWAVGREDILIGSGVVTGIAQALQAFTAPGDGVIIQPPVYHPFRRMIELAGRRVIDSPLLPSEHGRYRMDLQDVDEKARQGARLLILCSPHNPVGRVWARAELEGLADVCLEHDLIIVSDEIHGDLIYPGARHIPLASIAPRIAERTVTLTAPSKTFNLAGLQASLAIISDPELRRAYEAVGQRMALHGANLMGLTAMRAAYERGGPWLDELMDYIADNFAHLRRYVASQMPEVNVTPAEGTYLVWLDFRSLGLSGDELDRLMRERARVALNDGRMFGPGGEGFQRINIGCPRSILEEGLARIGGAVREVR